MKEFEENSIDAIICDPPYNLTASKKNGTGIASLNEDSSAGRSRITAGFMGQVWDATGIAFSIEVWTEALRVLKPGGHLLAFGSPRTHHRLMCAIEDAGFEIRDCLIWMYGEGMPKSLDVSKQFDKEAGAEREVVGRYQPPEMKKPWNLKNASDKRVVNIMASSRNNLDITAPSTDDARRWSGWGTNLKPSFEPIILARKPIAKGLTIAQNVRKYGTGAINIDGCRIEYENEEPPDLEHWKKTSDGWKNTSKAGVVPGDNTRGRWPANTVLSHSEDCVQVGVAEGDEDTINKFKDGAGHEYESFKATGGQVPIFACVPGCPIRLLDSQSGKAGARAKASGKTLGKSGTRRIYGATSGEKPGEPRCYGDTRGTSRFFYTTKARIKEKNKGCEDLFWKKTKSGMVPVTKEKWETLSDTERITGNIHPTVKPIALMRWLCRLVTPPDGIILDPFLGSGSTGVAAIEEGFLFVGIENDSNSMIIAKCRISEAERSK